MICTRYYVSIYGSVWSMSGPKFIAYLQHGAANRDPDPGFFGRSVGVRAHRGGEHTTAWQRRHDVIFPLDWTGKQFQEELDRHLAEVLS